MWPLTERGSRGFPRCERTPAQAASSTSLSAAYRSATAPSGRRDKELGGVTMRETNTPTAMRRAGPPRGSRATNRGLGAGPRRVMTLLCVGVVTLAAVAPGASAAATVHDPPRVMTRNLYLGANLDPVIVALASLDQSDRASVQRLMEAASAAYTQSLATDFRARAVALAREIEAWNPYLIGLQEVEIWRSGPLLDPRPADQVELDFLTVLLGQLAARGLHFAAVSTHVGFSAEVPTGAPYNRDIRLTDRDVVLARTDLPPGLFRVANPQSAHFAHALPLPGQSVTRGWASVDVQIVGRPLLRFATTHLEPASEEVARAQAAELVSGPLATRLPVILAGDLNSDPSRPVGSPQFSSAAYTVLSGVGLRDTGSTQNTCCHAADLLNATPTFGVRIDHVLTRPALPGISSHLVGDDPTNRASSAAGQLWPSDHAGLVVGIG
jgi:endonuclease/exonuclease/phosphatase family metal-dependent hydrolase